MDTGEDMNMTFWTRHDSLSMLSKKKGGTITEYDLFKSNMHTYELVASARVQYGSMKRGLYVSAALVIIQSRK